MIVKQAEPRPQMIREEMLRLHQANERTMLAWIRTGIALMAFGFAIARFGVFLRQIASVGPLAVRPQRGVGSAWVGGLPTSAFMVNLPCCIWKNCGIATSP